MNAISTLLIHNIVFFRKLLITTVYFANKMNTSIKPWNVSLTDDETEMHESSRNNPKDDETDSISMGSPNVFTDTQSDRSSVDSTEKISHSPTEKAWMKSVFLSNEAKRLNGVLEEMKPEEIRNILLDRLLRNDSKNLVALGILFPRASYPFVSNQHCVRCHVTFDKKSPTSCILRHSAETVQKLKQDPHGSDFQCTQCNNQFRIPNVYFYDENMQPNNYSPCFKGVHTTDTSEITYGGLYKTCEENGCIEFYV